MFFLILCSTSLVIFVCFSEFLAKESNDFFWSFVYDLTRSKNLDQGKSCFDGTGSD